LLPALIYTVIRYSTYKGLNCNKHAKIIPWYFQTHFKNNVYDYLTLNVHVRAENNIPHINFMKENSQDSVALKFKLNFTAKTHCESLTLCMLHF
jgi:hypothetical protein